MQNANEKRILLAGHPYCGGKYLAEILNLSDHDIGFEERGKDGTVDWKLINKSHNIHYLHYVQDPISALPSIMMNDRPDWYDHRNILLYKKYGINLDNYSTLNAAALSFLFWNKAISENKPNLVFHVEDSIESLVEYTQIYLQWKYNNVTVPDYIPEEGAQVNWNELRPDLLQALDNWCKEYDYIKLSTRIQYHNRDWVPDETTNKLGVPSPATRNTGAGSVLGPRTRTMPQDKPLIRRVVQEPSSNIRPRLVHKVVVQSQQGAVLSQRERQRRGAFSVRR